MEITEY